MSRTRRRKSNRIALALMLLLGAAAGTVALALYVKMTPADRVLPSGPETNVKGIPIESTPKQVLVKVPIVGYAGDRLTFTAQDVEIPSETDPKVEAVNQFLRGAKFEESGARLMSVDVDDDGVANLHFSAGFDSGQGSMDEAALIYGLRAVLGQFEDVRSVRFFVEGRQIQELGHIEVGESAPVIPVSRWGDPLDAPSESTSETPPPSMPR